MSDTNPPTEEVDLDELRALVLAGEIEDAVAIYEVAPPGTRAALMERLEDAPDHAMRNAALMFAQARDFSNAGQSFAESGDLESAAAAYESDGRYAQAAEVSREAGDLVRAAWALAREGHTWDAAEVFREAGDEEHEALMLRQVPDDHAQHADAVARLKQLAGEPEQPADKPAAAVARRARRPDRTALSALKTIPIFAELSMRDMHELYGRSEEREFVAGEHLLHRNQPTAGLFVLLEGEVQVKLGSRELNTLKAGEYVGEMGLVRDVPASADVVSGGATRSLFIPRERFEQFLASRPDAARRLFRLFTINLADRVAQLSKRAQA
jgi:hypothetical protein